LALEVKALSPTAEKCKLFCLCAGRLAMAVVRVAVCFFALASGQMPHRTKEEVAENARWVVHAATWGYLTALDGGSKLPMADTLSFCDGEANHSTGRLFFYLMGGGSAGRPASLTISEAALNTTCGNRDPEDPRCAKITLTGTMTRLAGKDMSLGKASLFARHPQMQTWPKGHGFEVHELVLSSIWMIDFYGGGGAVKVSDFSAAKARHNVPSWPPSRVTEFSTDATALQMSTANLIVEEPPSWKHTAARARWLVYHSIWGSVGTTSVHLKGAPWGNVRSVADGLGKNSTGVPVLYIPTPDPTSIDLAKDNHATLAFSEAALTERLTTKGTCDGMDSEDPTCARIALSGRLRALTTQSELAQAKLNLGMRHPLAPWLAQGGAHTGGKYYSMEIESITFLDFYGGPAKLTIADYLSASPVNAVQQRGLTTFV
jgi:hypothetical protein